MAQYVSVAGTARPVLRRYVSAAGVARAVNRGWCSVSGVARLYFGAEGVLWGKWSCMEDEVRSHYVRITDGVGECYTRTVYAGSASWATFGSYTFDEDSGFSLMDYGVAKPENIVGRYQGGDDEVRQVIDCTDNGDGTWTFTWQQVDAAVYEGDTVWEKGDTYYGLLRAEAGALPEAGELVSGDPAGTHCVVRTGSGTYYYYERAED